MSGSRKFYLTGNISKKMNSSLVLMNENASENKITLILFLVLMGLTINFSVNERINNRKRRND